MTRMREASVADMLDARERRARRQKRFLETSPTLVCLTMNIPGPIKTSPEILAAFREGVRRAQSALGGHPIRYEAFTGPEAYLPTKAEAAAVKRLMCEIEDEEPLGRLYDLDVLSGTGEKVTRAALGLSPRTCLLCGRPAFACARSRAHSVAELTEEISRRIDAWQRKEMPERIAEAAVSALLREAKTTPKPGLVDRRNCGSHPDMSLEMLLRSAQSLRSYFRECARAGFDTEEDEAFPLLRTLGMEAEKTMLRATGGVNTHKGAIFSLGLLAAAAAGCLRSHKAGAEEICARAGRMAAPSVEAHFRSLRPETARTFGDRLYLETGLKGARGEAAEGFSSVLHLALPALEANLRGIFTEAHGSAQIEAEDISGVYALLCLAAETNDTTLIRRGGLARAEMAKNEIRALLSSGVTREKAEAMDDRFIREGLTLGGCADLLACAYFLRMIRQP